MAPKQYNRRIAVDLFDGQLHGGQTLHCTERDIPGEAIDYDFTHDVGLIRIRPGRRLPSSRVVPTDWQAKPGLKMVTVGCSNGKDATAWDTKVLSPRVNMSNTETRQPFSTIKCAYQPREGRSGGGLYTMDGYVAGVCDFADPNEHTGLYATPESIHALLDRNKMTALYRPTGNPDRLFAANPGRPSASPGTSVRAQFPESSPAQMPGRITLPPPALAGVKMPKGEPGGWSPPASVAPSTRVASNSRRPEIGQRIVENGRGATENPIATDASVEPNPDERPFEEIARNKSRRPDPAPALAPGQWTRSTRPLPTFESAIRP